MNAITKPGEAALPAHLKDLKMTGGGVSSSSEDMLIPMLRILQQMSPEVEKKSASYVAGAEAGDIYIKNIHQPLIKGDDGFLFQPCAFYKKIVEWVPRNKGGGSGGGFVGAYDKEPDDAQDAPHPNDPEKKIRVRKNGNWLVDTRYHVGFLIDDETGQPMPAVIPFASTGHTISRGWMFAMSQKHSNGVKADSWAVYYHLKTRLKTRGTQAWYLFDIHDAGQDGTTLWVPSLQDYERGKALNAALESGQRSFEMNAADEAAAPEEKGKL